MNETKQASQVPPALEAQVAPTGREKLFHRLLAVFLIMLVLAGVARYITGNLEIEAMAPVSSTTSPAQQQSDQPFSVPKQ